MKKHIIFFLSLLLVSSLSIAQEDFKVGYKQEGQASYYANKFHGKKTASGEKFDMYAMTAAHPSLPFNSIVKLTNKSNAKWVTVRINDRGPFSKRRILDMSKAAALKLDIIKAGIADIELEVLKIPGQEGSDEEEGSQDNANGKKKEEEKDKKTQEVAVIPKKPAHKSSGSLAVDKESTKPQKVVAKNTTDNTSTKKDTPPKKTLTNQTNTPKKDVAKDTRKVEKTPEVDKSIPLNERFDEVKTYNVWGSVRQPKGYGIQLGSYNEVEKAIEVGKEAGSLGMKEIYIQTGWSSGKQVYRVLFASGANEDNVKQMLPIVKSKGFPNAFLRTHY